MIFKKIILPINDWFECFEISRSGINSKWISGIFVESSTNRTIEPGLKCNSYVWRRLFQRLSAGFTCTPKIS